MPTSSSEADIDDKSTFWQHKQTVTMTRRVKKADFEKFLDQRSQQAPSFYGESSADLAVSKGASPELGSGACVARVEEQLAREEREEQTRTRSGLSRSEQTGTRSGFSRSANPKGGVICDCPGFFFRWRQGSALQFD